MAAVVEASWWWEINSKLQLHLTRLPHEELLMVAKTFGLQRPRRGFFSLSLCLAPSFKDFLSLSFLFDASTPTCTTDDDDDSGDDET